MEVNPEFNLFLLLDMSVPIKRKRGRPRLDEPREIKDFDNNLIQEFKKFPAFYDRQHPQHRNREVTDRIWQRLAQNLHVSTNLVKTRMLQLRNRFNLEKRRLEAMKEQQPHSDVHSQWSLYENLSFLSDYVKTRRPYSMPVSLNPKVDTTCTSSDSEEEEQLNDTHKISGNALNSNQILNVQQSESMRNHVTAANGEYYQIPLPNFNNNLDLNNEGNNKYKAFGQFLASSLIEMNDIQALSLVEKFTTDLVKYLKIEERNKLSSTQQNNTVEDESYDMGTNGYC